MLQPRAQPRGFAGLCKARQRYAILPAARPLRRCRLHCVAGPAGSGTVKLRFQINYKTEMGDSLAIVGDGPELGSWQPERRIAMEWQEGDNWVGIVDVPAGAKLEYKYLLVLRDGSLTWSPGYNYTLEAAHTEGAHMYVYESWFENEPRQVDVHEPHPERANSNAAPKYAEVGLIQDQISRLEQALTGLKRTGDTGRIDEAVVGLLSHYPAMNTTKLYSALMANKPRLDIGLEQLKQRLHSMVERHVLVQAGDTYQLASRAPQTLSTRRNAPQPARMASPTPLPPPGGFAADPATPSAPAGVQPQLASVADAVLKMLGDYSGLSLSGMHTRLATKLGPSAFTLSPVQLQQQVLVPLVAERKVQLEGERYVKGPVASGGAGVRAGATPRPTLAAAAAVGAVSAPARVSAAARAAEPAVLKLLSNRYSASVDLLNAMLSKSGQFLGSARELHELLQALEAEGKVSEVAPRTYAYQNLKRSSTPRPSSTPATRPSSLIAAPLSDGLASSSNGSGSASAVYGAGGASGGAAWPAEPASWQPLPNAPGSPLVAASSSQTSSWTLPKAPAPSGSTSQVASATPLPAAAVMATPAPAPRSKTPALRQGSSVPAQSPLPAFADAMDGDGLGDVPAAPAPKKRSSSRAVTPRARSSTPTAARAGGEGTPARRAARDPLAPRRAHSAYNLFYSDNFMEAKASLPAPSALADVTRALADAWKSADKETRAYYTKAAAADKLRFEQEMSAYTAKQNGAA